MKYLPYFRRPRSEAMMDFRHSILSSISWRSSCCSKTVSWLSSLGYVNLGLPLAWVLCDGVQKTRSETGSSVVLNCGQQSWDVYLWLLRTLFHKFPLWWDGLSSFGQAPLSGVWCSSHQVLTQVFLIVHPSAPYSKILSTATRKKLTFKGKGLADLEDLFLDPSTQEPRY